MDLTFLALAFWIAGPEALDGLRGDPGRVLARVLDALGEPRPEWADMAAAILKDEAMDARGGWWRSGGTRYGWEWARRSFDLDRDEEVSPQEIPLSEASFERTDRDRDGVLTERDFMPPGRGQGQPSPAGALFQRLDRDSNGRVSRGELDRFFEEADEDGLGFLTQEDLAAALRPRRRGGGGEQRRETEGEPSRWSFLLMLFAGQLGSLGEGPRVGEMAPDFELPAHDGRSRLRLSGARGKRPVVLVFGSFT
ncbi:MAG: hypothetical protein HY721_31215 [Planctomycetes bacterium]|nr:hypothetical protein [Planctomycetota bacterium]